MMRSRGRKASRGARRAAVLTLAFAAIACASGWGRAAAAPTETAAAERAPEGASDLALAAGLSFSDDSSDAFPIVGRGLDAADIATGRPTAIFFAAAHCWNTNREAERFVAVYEKHRGDVRFLVVDVEHPSPGQQALMRRFYGGSIPTLAVLDRDGRPIFVEAGESARTRGDTTALEAIVRRALPPDAPADAR